jgi:hypothetical protein
MLIACKTPCLQQACLHPFQRKLHLCSLVAAILVRLLLV